MPVVGHACVGLATAQWATPGDSPCRGHPLWLPVFVLMAYAPDIVAQAAALCGLEAKVACHSVLFVVVCGTALGPVVSRWARAPWTWGVCVSVASMGGHVLLDALQSTDRRPLWPLSDYVLSGRYHLLPTGLGEIMLFGAVSGVAWIIGGRRRGVIHRAQSRRARLWSQALIALVLAMALGTQALRSMREHTFHQAVALLERGDHAGALAATTRASRWPSTGRPGRLAYARAEACVGLGERVEAERYYLLAVRECPEFFWAVADLALFYATADAPRAQRRTRVLPLIERLEQEFPDHERCTHVVSKITGLIADSVQ